MHWLFAAYAFGIGAIVGSFLNVVIHRYPREESIVFPASHCPKCNAAIRPWDNIPILSWLFLLGRCRSCREPIALRYPLVELANALLYLAVFQRTGISWAFLPVAAIASMTIVLIYIDLDIQILPDVIDLPGVAIGVAMAFFGVSALAPELVLAESWLDAAAGAALGALILLGIALAYQLVRKQEGMGLGDVKMLAMIGAVSGWRAVLPVLFLASVTGALAGLGIAAVKRTSLKFALPFGVFLGIAFLAVLFFGHTLFAWYLALLLR